VPKTSLILPPVVFQNQIHDPKKDLKEKEKIREHQEINRIGIRDQAEKEARDQKE